MIKIMINQQNFSKDHKKNENICNPILNFEELIIKKDIGLNYFPDEKLLLILDKLNKNNSKLISIIEKSNLSLDKGIPLTQKLPECSIKYQEVENLHYDIINCSYYMEKNKGKFNHENYFSN